MWINKEKCDFFALNEKKSQEIIKGALGWAEKNPEATVFVWYDSKFVNNAEAVIQNIKNEITNKKIIFRDINDLDLVKENIAVFSNDLALYFRVDLLREIIAYEKLKTDEMSCFIYSDIDMDPITKDQLFDDETVYLLNKYGIIMPRGGIEFVYENGFQMAVKDTFALKAIKDILIDVNIAIANSFLKKMEHKELLGQRVYSTFPIMFRYLYFLKYMANSKSKIYINEIKKTAVTCHWNTRNCSVSNILSTDIILKKGLHWFYPTKSVALPPAGLKYND
jgi:hypothetical protein